MEFSIGFAASRQEDELNNILQGHGMGLAGDIGDHVALVADGKVLGGGLLWQLDQDVFHLLVLGVAQDGRRQGIGGRLLNEICSNPWQYCRDAAEPVGASFRITTVARGEAVPFYQKCGFRTCDPDELPDPFGAQCGECPDRAECNPATMVFQGAVIRHDERDQV